jgi:hypothetical protein
MFGPKAARWFGILFLLMLGLRILRIGYKYYQAQQPWADETQMAQAQSHVEALLKTVEADQARQRANGAKVVLADSTLTAADTAVAN